MRPASDVLISRHSGFPRVSGDAPSRVWRSLMGLVFSPRERGCAYVVIRLGDDAKVFPA